MGSEQVEDWGTTGGPDDRDASARPPAQPPAPPAPSPGPRTLSRLQRFWPTGANVPARKPDPEPLETHDQTVIIIGTTIWAIAFVVMLAMHQRLEDQGRGWWPWTALAGVGLGFWGMNVVRRRAARRTGGSPRRPD